MTKRFRTSALFECETCSMQWQDLKTAREDAYRHAVNRKHNVRGEIGTAYHYDFNQIMKKK